MSAVNRRVQHLDTIAAVLPMERRDELAELLTDQDVETLRHLVKEGMGANTLRALTSDLARSVVISTLIHAKGILQVTGNT